MRREGPCRQISLACLGSTHSVPATLGLPPLTACVLPLSTLLSSWLLYRERALSCMHLPGPSCSGSGFRVLHKMQTWLGLHFVPSPAQAAQATTGAPYVSSGKLISGCDPLGGCRPSRISASLWLETGSLFLQFGRDTVSGAEFAPFPSPLPLPRGMGQSATS